MARDSFLAHLGSTLWGSMRHVVAPSVSHRAYHYYEKLSFQLYFVTQEVAIVFLLLIFPISIKLLTPCIVLFLIQKVRTIKQLPINVKSIRDGLSSLLLPSQKSMFTQHMYVYFIFSILIYSVITCPLSISKSKRSASLATNME